MIGKPIPVGVLVVAAAWIAAVLTFDSIRKALWRAPK